ncbi:MAG: Crp/Fnr family transcriptional regulator [Chloroflexi bacterium]|nr:Crp/Fnr family transcriptional regulator [Chloroflexota bacterium]
MMLARCALFSDLESGELQSLAGCLRRRWFAKGDPIYFTGDPGSCLFFLEVGQVKLVLTSPEGRELVVALIGPGELFGEAEVIDGKPRCTDAAVQQPCQLVVLQRRDFLRFVEARPSVAFKLLATLSERLRSQVQTLQDAVFQNVSARLARTILGLAEATTQTNTSCPVTSRFTQSELAGMIGATRESVNKWLGIYERQGVIHRCGSQIQILRPEVLRQRAS